MEPLFLMFLDWHHKAKEPKVLKIANMYFKSWAYKIDLANSRQSILKTSQAKVLRQ